MVDSSLGSSREPSVPSEDSDHSDDEYIDTVENPEPKKPLPNGYVSNYDKVGKEHVSRSRRRQSSQTVEINDEILITIQNLKTDIDSIKQDLKNLDNITKQTSKLQTKQPKLFDRFSPQFLAFIIAWPFIASFIMNRIFTKKRI